MIGDWVIISLLVSWGERVGKALDQEVSGLIDKMFSVGTTDLEVKKIASIIRKKTTLHKVFLPFESYLVALKDEENSLSWSADKSGAVFQILIWISPRVFLEKNKEVFLSLMKNASLAEKDRIFSRAMLEYKCGSYKEAEMFLLKLKGEKDRLDFFQTGGMSYRHVVDLTSLDSAEPYFVYLSVASIKNPKGVYLFSCDLGYLHAYWDHVFSANRFFDEKIFHFNVVFPRGYSLEKAKQDVLKVFGLSEFPDNFSITLEICNLEGSIKTYSSISRYVVLPYLLDFYDSPVAVSDIDIDFDVLNTELVREYFTQGKVYLRFRDAEFPWHKILAGFNIFPCSSLYVDFSSYLSRFLWGMFAEGYDGWMLDQVGLYVIYREFIKREGLSSFKDSCYFSKNIFNVSQVSGRGKLRESARDYRLRS